MISDSIQVTSSKDVLIFPVITLSVISLAILWHRSRKSTPSLPPGPRGLPVVGYLPFLGTDLHHEFAKLAQRYGPIFKLKLGSKTYVIVSSSDLAKTVVREQDNIFANRDPLVAGRLITYGGIDITWSDNNAYRTNLRKVLVSEVLSNKNLEASLTFRRAGVRKIIKQVYATTGSTELDVGAIAFTSSLSVVTSMMWGRSLDEEEKNINLGAEFREVITKIVDLVGAANLSDVFPAMARFDLQGIERETKRQFQKVDEIFQRIIEDRMSLKSEESSEQHGRKDLLQIFLELKQDNSPVLSIPQIKALFMDIVTGGTDTTATMAEWTMAELLKNPKLMKKVQDELEQVVGLNNIVEESHIPKLHYLDATIKETFRLHPPLPLLIGRCPNQSCKVGGYTVPKGSNVFLNVWAIHRDPQYWENPTKFDPKRFINSDGTTKFDYNGYNTNFMGFGSGRRRCPGLPLGEKMLVYLLASLLHSFDWTMKCDEEHNMSDKFGIVLKKRNPLMVIPSQRLLDKDLYM